MIVSRLAAHPITAVIANGTLSVSITPPLYGVTLNWNDEKFEKLLADARAETDEAKRKPYIWEMQAILNERGEKVFSDVPEEEDMKLIEGSLGERQGGS